MITKTMQKKLQEPIKKYIKILKDAYSRDVNESDTVKIINGMLECIFGYDRFSEITGEHQIRGTYCDIAIKIKDKIHFLIEVKAIGIKLKESHVKQAIDYSANQGINWTILTNGIIWEVYRVIYGKPIDKELVLSIDFLNDNFKDEKNTEKLYILTKEALSKNLINAYYEKIKIVNKFIISSIIQTDKIVNTLRYELRKYFKNIKVDPQTIKTIIVEEILKRELVDSDEGKLAMREVQRAIKKSAKKVVKPETIEKKNEEVTPTEEDSTSVEKDGTSVE